MIPQVLGKKELISAGVTIVTVSVGLFASGWPAYIQAHVWTVWGSSLIGMTLLVSGLFLRGGGHPSSGPGITIISPIENLPQNNPTFVNAPVFNLQAEPNVQAEQAPPKSDSLVPNLVIRGAKKMMLKDAAQRFISSSTGRLGMVVLVENREAREEGQRAIKARGISAVVRFSSAAGLSGTIQRAFWLDHWENEINIGIGEGKYIVIGQYDTRVWSYFNNPRNTKPPAPRTSSQLRNMAERMSPALEAEFLFMNNCLDVEVTIISVDTGHTVARRSFTICTDQDSTDFEIKENL